MPWYWKRGWSIHGIDMPWYAALHHHDHHHNHHHHHHQLSSSVTGWRAMHSPPLQYDIFSRYFNLLVIVQFWPTFTSPIHVRPGLHCAVLPRSLPSNWAHYLLRFPPSEETRRLWQRPSLTARRVVKILSIRNEDAAPGKWRWVEKSRVKSAKCGA